MLAVFVEAEPELPKVDEIDTKADNVADDEFDLSFAIQLKDACEQPEEDFRASLSPSALAIYDELMAMDGTSA